MKSRRIYMLKVGERDAPSINHLYLEENAPPRLLTCMYFWCVVDETGPVVIDQGFSAQTLKDLNIPFRFEAEPPELLRRIGIDVQDVRNVILTHLHWDHYSGEEFFPRATYFVQQREMDFLVNPLIRYRALGRFYNRAALEKIVRLHLAGRVEVIDGDHDLFPGISSLWTGGHSPGSQAVVVETKKGSAVICGDVVPRYQNVCEDIPCGIHTNTIEAVQALKKVKARAGSMDLILTGHDPEAMQKYPRVADGVYLIEGELP